jgi:SAM-dependent methyltransferase
MTELSQQEWLTSILGQYLLAKEQAVFDTLVGDMFGYHALQVGFLQLNALNSSRIAHLMQADFSAGDFFCDSDYLPLSENSIDLICLPHALEYSHNPHQTLREAERVLVPEGHLIITGFNPISAWGVKYALKNNQQFPWHGHFFTLSRIKDWLALLGMEFVSGQMHCYEPPVNDEKWLRRFAFMDKFGDKWWPMLGGVYVIVAKKRVANMTLLKPNWKKSSIKSRLVVNSQKTKPNQKAIIKSNNKNIYKKSRN